VASHHGRLERLSATPDHGDLPPQETSRRGSEFTRLLVHVSRPLCVQDLAADSRVESTDACPEVDAGPALFVPMRRREHASGYLAAFRSRGAPAFSPTDARQLSLLAAWTAMAIENLRLSESVEKLAVTDDLTQVYNYRFLKMALKRELKRSARFGQELGLVMLDVDNLKAYNDRNGHLRGSYLLREMAALLARQVRSFDLIAKYGETSSRSSCRRPGSKGRWRWPSACVARWRRTRSRWRTPASSPSAWAWRPSRRTPRTARLSSGRPTRLSTWRNGRAGTAC
jgi:hypothetical protein